MPARYRMTPARKAALKRAQEISARKRRKWRTEISKKRRKKPEAQKKRRRRAAVAVGLVGAVGAAAVTNKIIKVKLEKLEDQRWNQELERIERENAAKQAEIERLTKIAGNVYGRPENQEELDARIKLYGPVTPEFSAVHNGRPEIHPGVPQALVVQQYANETAFPSDRIDTSQDIVMYHRTGGGADVDPEAAAQSIIESQSLVFLNRDETNMAKALKNMNSPNAAAFELHARTARYVWMSNKLNDSNTRNAFGETVIKITIPAAIAQQMQQMSFGQMSPGEVWGYIDPALLVGAKFERVPPEEITPKVEPKFRIP